jgi:hypothetical protein
LLEGPFWAVNILVLVAVEPSDWLLFNLFNVRRTIHWQRPPCSAKGAIWSRWRQKTRKAQLKGVTQG